MTRLTALIEAAKAANRTNYRTVNEARQAYEFYAAEADPTTILALAEWAVKLEAALVAAQSELYEGADKFWVIHCNHPGKSAGRAQGEDKEFCSTMAERMQNAGNAARDLLAALPKELGE